MTFQIVITLIMFLIILVLLLKGVSSPGVIFTGIPILAAFIMGFTPREIQGFLMSGLQSVSGTIFLMVFAVLYFGMLHDAGVFKVLIRFITRFLKNSVPSTILTAQIISMLTQLDGSGATTALCTIPSMRPIFEKQKIRMEALLLVETLGSGVLLILPWMPGFIEGSAYVGLDVYGSYRYLIPVLVFGIVLFLLMCIPISVIEKRHGAGMTEEEFREVKDSINQKIEYPYGRNTAIFDGVFTLLLMACILSGKVPANLAFGFGFTIMLLVNHRSPDSQGEYMKKNAPVALNMAFTMLGVGVLVGVNNGTGAMTDFANLMAGGMPSAMIAYVPLILCILGLPLSMVVGNAMGAIIVPAVVSMTAAVGYSAIEVQPAMWVAIMCGANLSLFNASPYLALGLAGVEMKNHLKYSFLPVWGFSVILVLFMTVTGLLPV